MSVPSTAASLPAGSSDTAPTEAARVVSPPIPETPATSGTPADTPAPNASVSELDDHRASFYDKIEAFISKLSTRDNFWHRICSFIWLPLAFFSGIKMKQLDEKTYGAYLPFTKFNRNWYNAMAGGALLGNAEIAGGMYVFGIVGENYTVVCKHLDYKFLRPCLGPALYKMTPVQNIHELLRTSQEFDIVIDMNVEQQMRKQGERDRRVGKAAVTFHVTHKQLHRLRAKRKQKGKELNAQ